MIGIVTLYYKNNNYGGLLQALALQNILNQEGYENEILNMDRSKLISFQYTANHKEKRGVKRYLKKIVNKILYVCFNQKYNSNISSKRRKFDEFKNLYVKSSSDIFDKENIHLAVNKYEEFISGSDQVFSPISSKPETFLSFVPNIRTKIAYAASFGANDIDNEFKKEIHEYLIRFNSISVREANAKAIIHSIVAEKPVDVVLDPTLLYSGDWSRYMNKVPCLDDKEYELLYFIGEDSTEWKVAYTRAKKSGHKIANIPYNKFIFCLRDCINSKNNIEAVGPGEFLWLIKNAAKIHTDSFHGVVFSILFNKKIYYYNRKSENANGNMNSRILSLCETLDLIWDYKSNQIIYDRSEVERKLAIARNDSLNFLRRALSE